MSPRNRGNKIGLLGTITYDFITSATGNAFQGLGGILYQAAALCGLGQDVTLFTNVGQDLVPLVEASTREWTTLSTDTWTRVPGPGNRVRLHYPEQGERQEVLESVVPALDPRRILPDLPLLDFLVLVINSGYDITLQDWRTVVEAAACPIWLDIHSLPLSKGLNVSREYRPVPDWQEWATGVDYIQANAAEVASLTGEPGSRLEDRDLEHLANLAQETGAKAIFVTLGREGVQVLTSRDSVLIPTQKAETIADATGCGDVLCAATVARLRAGDDAFAAAAFGARMATEAVEVAGVEKTFELIREMSGSTS
ncbi:MAG: carbohydrate kinase family protein [Candidatus Aminicenantaceae bacterium]